MDKSKIQKQAKEILDRFAAALDKAGVRDKIVYVDREEFEREENGENCKGFKEKLLENAPHSDGDFIIGEKGGWKW